MTVIRRSRASAENEPLQRVSDRVAAALESRELPPTRRPKTDGQPVMPIDLSDLEDRELISLMSRLTVWADYAAGLLAVAEVDLEECESVLKKMRDEHAVTSWEDDHADHEGTVKSRKGVTVRKSELATSAPYVEAEQERLNAYASVKMLGARFESYSRRGALCSRELTRRTDRDSVSRRSARGSN